MKNRDQMCRPDDDGDLPGDPALTDEELRKLLVGESQPDDARHDVSAAPVQGTWIVRRRRRRVRAPVQRELPLGDDLDDVLSGDHDPNLASSFGAPLTEEKWKEVLEELDRAVEEMIAEEETPQEKKLGRHGGR